jgi:hypothetical protein
MFSVVYPDALPLKRPTVDAAMESAWEALGGPVCGRS